MNLKDILLALFYANGIALIVGLCSVSYDLRKLEEVVVEQQKIIEYLQITKEKNNE